MGDQLKEHYKNVETFASRDVQKAAILSQADAAHAQVATIEDEDNAPLLPVGARIIFRPIDAARITKGHFLFLRRSGTLIVRRLIRRQVTPGGLYLVVATASGKMDPPIPAANLLGEILAAELPDGKRIYPHKAGTAFGNWLTDWGTCSVGQKLGRMLLVVVPPGMRKPE